MVVETPFAWHPRSFRKAALGPLFSLSCHEVVGYPTSLVAARPRASLKLDTIRCELGNFAVDHNCYPDLAHHLDNCIDFGRMPSQAIDSKAAGEHRSRSTPPADAVMIVGS